MRKLLPLSIIFICFTSALYAQNQSLRLARSVYEQGRLQEIPSILTDKLIASLSTAEQVEAYKLLCLTNIYLEEPELADSYMLKILQTNHEFVLNRDAEPAEFVALYETFRHDPIYRVGIKLGAVAAQPNVVSAEAVVEGTSKYKYRFGFHAAVAGELPITNKVTLSAELGFQLRSFKNTVTVNPDDTTTFTATGLETGAWITLPMQVQYEFHKRKYTYYVAGGASLDYLLASTLKITRIRDEFSIVDEKSVDILEQRNKLNYSLLASIGAKRKIGTGLLVAELRYQFGLRPGLTKQDVFENQELVYDYHYADAIFTPRSLSFTIGYLINIYNPKKLTVQKSKK